MNEVNLLDLRGIPCPINFVRTKLKLDTMLSGEVLELWLDNGQPIESVHMSVIEEGHLILSKDQQEEAWLLRIQRA